MSELKRLREDIIQHPKVNIYKPSPVIFDDKVKPLRVKLPNGEMAEYNSKLYLKEENFPFNSDFGEFIEKQDSFTVIKKGNDFVSIRDNDPIWEKLTIKDSDF